MTTEDFGNFHYGAVGKASSFSDYTLYTQAGQAQIRSGTSKREYFIYAPSRGAGHGGEIENYCHLMAMIHKIKE
jgi:hypothetical protein